MIWHISIILGTLLAFVPLIMLAKQPEWFPVLGLNNFTKGQHIAMSGQDFIVINVFDGGIQVREKGFFDNPEYSLWKSNFGAICVALVVYWLLILAFSVYQ